LSEATTDKCRSRPGLVWPKQARTPGTTYQGVRQPASFSLFPCAEKPFEEKKHSPVSTAPFGSEFVPLGPPVYQRQRQQGAAGAARGARLHVPHTTPLTSHERRATPDSREFVKRKRARVMRSGRLYLLDLHRRQTPRSDQRPCVSDTRLWRLRLSLNSLGSCDG
jgi:hypothetical protein